MKANSDPKPFRGRKPKAVFLQKPSPDQGRELNTGSAHAVGYMVSGLAATAVLLAAQAPQRQLLRCRPCCELCLHVMR